MITLHACAACGHTLFPARQLCPRCGGAAWLGVACDRGVVVAVTTVQHSILAELRTPPRVRVIVRLPCAMIQGTIVALHETSDGALWGDSCSDEQPQCEGLASPILTIASPGTGAALPAEKVGNCRS